MEQRGDRRFGELVVIEVFSVDVVLPDNLERVGKITADVLVRRLRLSSTGGLARGTEAENEEPWPMTNGSPAGISPNCFCVFCGKTKTAPSDKIKKMEIILRIARMTSGNARAPSAASGQNKKLFERMLQK
jgi:hypothetical protein